MLSFPAIASNSLFTAKTSPSLFSRTPLQRALADTHKCGLSIAQAEPGLQPAPFSCPAIHNTLFSKTVVQSRTARANDNVQRGLFDGSSEPVTTSTNTFTHLPHPAGLFEKTSVYSQHNHTSWPCSQPTSHSGQSLFNTVHPTQHHGDLKVNPFYARMQELPQNPSSPDEDINPFLTALQKDMMVSTRQSAVSRFPSSSPTSSQQFSFSLAQINS